MHCSCTAVETAPPLLPSSAQTLVSC
ncbi:hypothetical protein CRUP_008689 [Coryphaenoides rupestris]|nr:hypothetical protein CRUP_008689 [Coryphaenoides rupestris]